MTQRTQPTPAVRSETSETKCSLMNVTQDLLWDYNFLSKSETVFKRLQLSGTFSEDANVYPEVLFNDVRLLADLVNVSNDGNKRTILNKTYIL